MSNTDVKLPTTVPTVNTTFELGLRKYLEEKPKLSIKEKRVLAVLNWPQGPLRSKVLDHFESSAKTEMKHNGMHTGNEAIDWSKIDWATLLTNLMPLLMTILKLFGV